MAEKVQLAVAHMSDWSVDDFDDMIEVLKVFKERKIQAAKQVDAKTSQNLPGLIHKRQTINAVESAHKGCSGSLGFWGKAFFEELIVVI